MKEKDSFTTLPLPVVIFFFMVGILSALAFRALVLVQRFDPVAVRLFWYIGVCGYILFFLYRYLISRRRKRVIRERSLLEKLDREDPLDRKDRNALRYVIASVDRSLENYNYYVIFILSVLAVLADLLLSFFRL